MGRPWARPAAAVSAVWLAGALIFYRSVWSSGFDRLMGVPTDNRLVAYLCEHWFGVLHGQASWRNPGFYFPVKGLLGWSDAFFLYLPAYVPLREFGCDPEVALQVTLILLSALGFATFYRVTTTMFGVGARPALGAALVFTFGNDLYLHVDSPQLGGVYLLPGLVLLAGRAWQRRLTSPRRAGLIAAAAGALYGLLFFTTFYVALFAGLAAAVAAGWSLVIGGLTRPRRRLRGGGRPPGLLVAAYSVGLAVGITPFLVTYLPVHASRGGVGEAEVLTFSPAWWSLLDTGSGNLVWGAVIHPLLPRVPPGAYESTYAVTPVLLAALIGSAGWMARRLWAGRRLWAERAGPQVPPRPAGMVVALTALTLMVLPVKLGGRPAWLLLWPLPGFDAIRAVDRLGVVTASLAVLAVTAAGDGGRRRVALAVPSGPPAPNATPPPPVTSGPPRRHSSRARRFGLGLLVALVLAEQVNTAAVAGIDGPADARLLASVKPPPPGCRYFYLLDTSAVDRGNSALPLFDLGSPISQVDAMLIAQKVGLPTLNGYTGGSPAGWHLDPIGGPGYLAAVRSWETAERTGPGACTLDLTTLAWARQTG